MGGFTKLIMIGVVAALFGFPAYYFYEEIKQERTNKPVTVVEEAISSFDLRPDEVFVEFNDRSNDEWHYTKNDAYIFVVDIDTHDVIVPAARWERELRDSQRALIYYLITRAKETPDGTWVTYDMENPSNGRLQPKRSFIKLHEGYLFGAGKFRKEDLRYHY